MQLKYQGGYIGYLIGSFCIVFVWLIEKGFDAANSEG